MARCSKEQALQTRERLLDAALAVFYEEGVSRPSLSKVAARAGLTRGAVYGHFANRSSLFSALCDRVLLPAEALEAIRQRGQADPLGALRNWCVFVLRDLVEDPARRQLLEVIFHKCEITEANAVVGRRRAQARHAGVAHVQELIAAAVAQGQIEGGIDQRAAAWWLHASLVGLLSQWLLGPEDFDLPALAERQADWMMEALRSRGGE